MKRSILHLVGHLATAPARRSFAAHARARTVSFCSADGVRLSAWLLEPDDARGTLVLAHGYRDDRRQLLSPLQDALIAHRVRALAIDFRAHGESEGRFVTIGHDEAQDVVASLARAEELAGPVGYLGFSMGAAAYLLARREADFAILDSPYDTLREAIFARTDRFWVPRRLAESITHLRPDLGFPAIDASRPIDGARDLSSPTLFVFAPGDPWIPSATRERFRAAMSPRCRVELLPRGGHDDHFSPAWVDRVMSFVDEQLRRIAEEASPRR